ncbi:MAG: flagellar basal body protein [Planctomycetota bacterium]|nr:flagellar basal body protein [Planctomycetota bacterium]
MIGNLSQIEHLSALMQHSQTRQEVISSNIANVNTPMYKTQDVRFEEVLENLGKGIRQQAEVYDVEGLTVRQDGNNVDLNHELAKLTKNVLAYQTYSQVVASKLGTYRAAITGRA